MTFSQAAALLPCGGGLRRALVFEGGVGALAVRQTGHSCEDDG